MNTKERAETEDRPGLLRMADGKIYFSRQLERKIFFVLTMAMLAAGVGYRLMG